VKDSRLNNPNQHQTAGSSPTFTVAYVLTSDGRDVFADMALVSMLSVRISNPCLRIVAVCDEPSAQAIKAAKHRVLEICDELISVPTPDGEPTFRNRWIKTQLCNFISGNVLHLDADTLVRGSLADLPQLVSEFGAVPNHNGPTLAEQVWDEDRRVFEQMGWPVNYRVFVNGGVWFFKSCPRVHEFFAKWYELWSAGVAANGRLRDQPSLNSSILLSRVDLKILSPRYNAQLAKSWSRASDAVVWHFYATEGGQGTSFTHLLKKTNRMSLGRLQNLIQLATGVPAPWPNFGWFARIIAKRAEWRGTAKTEEWLWLNHRRKDALRFTMGKAKKVLFGQIKS
jgi:hypothetical protein